MGASRAPSLSRTITAAQMAAACIAILAGAARSNAQQMHAAWLIRRMWLVVWQAFAAVV